MATIQLDSRELLFDSMRPLFENISSDEGQVQAAIERLRGWDGQLRRDSVPAALFEVFYMQLAQRVLADELGAVADDYLVNGRTQRLFFHQLAQTPDAAWWDNVTTDGVESAESITLSALADTIAWFDDKVGGGMNDWTWGSIHAVTFRTQVLGASGIGPIEAMFNRGPYPVDGGESIVNANSFSWGETMAEVDWHPSLRFVVDMAALDAVQVIIPTGQSGHAYHPHYADMAQLWADGAFVTLPFSAEAVEDAAAHTLTLTP
jgi:penicillin amidase